MVSKKILAFALASAMVFGSTFTSFAAEDNTTKPGENNAATELEGAGTTEGLVDLEVFRVNMPTVTAALLAYTIDPQGLVEKTEAAKYGENVEFEAGSLYFQNHDAEGTLTKVSPTSDVFKAVNKSSTAVKITVSTKATVGSVSGGVNPVLAESATFEDDDTAAKIYLAYKDNGATTDYTALTASYVDSENVLADAAETYEYAYDSDTSKYTYAWTEDADYAYPTLEFSITGAVNTNADYGTDTAKVGVPTIGLKYLVEIAGDDDEVNVGTSSSGGSSTTAAVTGTGMTAAASGSAWDYEATFTKGTAYDINFTGVTGATWSSTVDGTYAVSANITTGTNKVSIASGNWAGASAGDARFVKVTDGTNTYIIKFTIATN